ncbi:ABC transporter substrate-binding protein [Rhodococcus sp. BP-349]|uniref:ABC transporter substrate-binding protein n=1 Tax=unclassified Rhodococcus (in: high G+C Gram-positive bacteria) TaxID=192944 RepID=UPI001C9A98C1|nr:MULTISPECIES: ABC transporter substrate-binding protein [unclassified Rhodococcus (in: high G+C Gram-positive bacteria)]MBY6538004.1 ABC transporter substrate-binding protein [Rhodococcus sp. BP-363]MBY6542341.1 ABC transporter substrate-binding protein [Rhodococcus sp. BP-369]MBY6561571.1 ABC transporter substrate-binding protein [Rhodococcus sp. BP-370]MBY6575863.1 ABC transporter substrate-binding protein [Rhodococcus sp. BP-364]MBY6585164.1 ABC transporter substrate-binding protein [Rho
MTRILGRTARRTNRSIAVLIATAAVTAQLIGCSTSDPAEPASTTTTDESFPKTVRHMYGETTLDSAPTRVATWGAGATDAVLALGVMPVAMPSTTYGGGDDLTYPWIAESIARNGGGAPALLDDVLGPLSVEKLVAADPDVLLAPHSGLTRSEYDAVTSAGIPVVAPPSELWSTPWRDTIGVTGEVLGKSVEAIELVSELDQQVVDAGARHPEFRDRTIAYVSEAQDVYYLLLPSDPRVELLENLGFTSDPSVTELATGDSTFSTAVSSEEISRIDASVVFTQVDTDTALQQFMASDVSRQIPAVATGAVAGFVGQEAGAAIGPTALTIPYFLPTLVDGLATAVGAAER